MKKLPLTTEMASDLVSKLMMGNTLTSICKSKEMPSLSKVYNFIQTDKNFATKILTARRIGAQTYLDKMIDELEHCTHKDAYLVNLKLQHYRWLASKLIAVYGDRKEVAVDQRIEISWNAAEDKSYENDARNVTNSGSTQEANTIERTS